MDCRSETSLGEVAIFCYNQRVKLIVALQVYWAVIYYY